MGLCFCFPLKDHLICTVNISKSDEWLRLLCLLLRRCVRRESNIATYLLKRSSRGGHVRWETGAVIMGVLCIRMHRGSAGTPLNWRKNKDCPCKSLTCRLCLFWWETNANTFHLLWPESLFTIAPNRALCKWVGIEQWKKSELLQLALVRAQETVMIVYVLFKATSAIARWDIYVSYGFSCCK